MTTRQTYTRSWKPIVGAAIVWFVLASLFYTLDGAAQWCSLLDKNAWAVLEVLRSTMLVAGCHILPPYLREGSRFLQLLLQLGACAWPLVCAVAGLA